MKHTFETWMREVDREIERRTGMSYEDLPDWRYRDAFDEGMTPKRAAAAAIREASDSGRLPGDTGR